MKTITYQVECTARDLVLLLMERRGLDLVEALRLLYASDTYRNLKDPATGLYFQSPGYVYAYLDREASATSHSD